MVDHFYEIERQMHAISTKRARLQRIAGQKLVHCKLSGHEDIAEEFKRLIQLQSQGTYYAVKEARMKPLIDSNAILPTKEVQQRIEGTEREIFALLSADNAKNRAIITVKRRDLTLKNCLDIVNGKLDELNNKLKDLSNLEEELNDKDVYTKDGFLKRDVEMKLNLDKNKADLESQLAKLQTQLQQSTSQLEEDKMLLSAAEGKASGLMTAINSKKDDIQNTNIVLKEIRNQTSILREERNTILCRTLMQRKALNLEEADNSAVKATESLHAKQDDIELQIREKSEKLRMLKEKQSDLKAEEKNLNILSQTHQSDVDQEEQANVELDDKISGVRENEARIKSDLETCIEDVAKKMDLKGTIWRDRAVKSIFNAGVLDATLFKPKIFADPTKHKDTDKRWIVSNALKCEIAMLQSGIADLDDKISNLKADMASLKNRNKITEKNELAFKKEAKKCERSVDQSKSRLDQLDKMTQSLLKNKKKLMEQLAEVITKSRILETLDLATKKELLGPQLEELEAKMETDDIIKEYNTLKKDVLAQPDKFSRAMAYEFLQREWAIQTKLEERLTKQLENVEYKAAQS